MDHKIIIKWDGPYSYNEVIQNDGKNSLRKLIDHSEELLEKEIDYGVYQIYGTHPIFGPNSLLYIGKASEQEFRIRFMQHTRWISQEMDDIKFYLGRVMDKSEENFRITNEIWRDYIDIAERLLLYYCCPPYNSASLNLKKEAFGNDDYFVLNYGKKASIPYEVSSLHHTLGLLEDQKEYLFLKYKG
ncbi:MAG TPA: hypothetical protein DEA97_06885 [Bacteroidales bacterium]|nr:MAG: hypothetical protein UR43_C0013G0016 [candidate division TM6 bacterium GW2011_GWF2_33_332]OFY78400.1 MAG: hypothetical protein A2281_11940 [Bacteroidetes bacterium RIFOXYA12_FULL_38_20]HBS86262.1 hypothetical protein [Bacteroidales bacterium]